MTAAEYAKWASIRPLRNGRPGRCFSIRVIWLICGHKNNHTEKVGPQIDANHPDTVYDNQAAVVAIRVIHVICGQGMKVGKVCGPQSPQVTRRGEIHTDGHRSVRGVSP